MPTTSLKLPQELKQLTIAAAKHQGISTHAFMVDAIRFAAENAQKRASFIADAVAARDAAIESGLGYESEDVYAYLRMRSQGKTASRPKASSWQE